MVCDKGSPLPLHDTDKPDNGPQTHIRKRFKLVIWLTLIAAVIVAGLLLNRQICFSTAATLCENGAQSIEATLTTCSILCR